MTRAEHHHRAMSANMIAVKAWSGEPGRYHVSDKLDGHRLLLRRGEAYRRSGARNEWDRLPATIRDRAGDEWLDGELVATGRPAAAVQTALADHGAGLAFRPFRLVADTLDFLAERHRLVSMGWQPPNYFGHFDATEVELHWPTWAQTVNEGVVLRGGGGKWWKLKRAHSIDLPVVGVKPGGGRLAGLIGALVCRLPLGGTVAVGVGLSDEQRTGAADAFIGRIAEVGYQARAAAGSLQHPRFVRWRDDLDGTD